MTGVFSIIDVGSTYQIVAGILISVVFVYVYDRFEPYPNPADDLLQELAQYIVLLALVGALLLRTQAFAAYPGGDDSVGVALVVLVSAFLALAAHCCLVQLLPAYKAGMAAAQDWLGRHGVALGWPMQSSAADGASWEVEALRAQLRDKEMLLLQSEVLALQSSTRAQQLERELQGLRARGGAASSTNNPMTARL